VVRRVTPNGLAGAGPVRNRVQGDLDDGLASGLGQGRVDAQDLAHDAAGA